MRFRIWIYVCFFCPPSLLDTSQTHKSPRCPERKAQISCAKNQNVFYVIYTLAQRDKVKCGQGGGGGGRVSLYSCHCSAAPVGPSLRWQLNTFIKHVKSTRGREWEAQAMQCVATTRHQVAPVRVNFSHPLTGWWTAQFKSHITHTFINKHTIDARENCG